MKSDQSKKWSKLLGVPAKANPLQVCKSFEKLAVALAPKDLKGLPLYAMPVSALPAEFVVASRFTGGWYSDLAYHWARPYLPDDRGPGPTFFVNDIMTDESARELATVAQMVLAVGGEHVEIEELLEFVPPIKTIESICQTLVHELAHALESLANGDWQMWCEIASLRSRKGRKKKLLDTSAKFDELVSRSQSQTEKGPPRLDAHGLRFTRIIAHLDHRLQSAGIPSGDYRAAGELFEQRDFSECRDALVNEMEKCHRKSFADILASPMPPAFERCNLNCEKKAVA